MGSLSPVCQVGQVGGGDTERARGVIRRDPLTRGGPPICVDVRTVRGRERSDSSGQDEGTCYFTWTVGNMRISSMM